MNNRKYLLFILCFSLIIAFLPSDSFADFTKIFWEQIEPNSRPTTLSGYGIIDSPNNASFTFNGLGDAPSRVGNAGKVLTVKTDESGYEWTTKDSNIVTFVGSSTLATNSLILSADYPDLITVSATDTLKFTVNCSMIADFEHASFKMDGILANDNVNGIRFIGEIIKTSWKSTSDSFNLIASYTSNGTLRLIASGPANLSVKCIVIPTKNSGNNFKIITSTFSAFSTVATNTLNLVCDDITNVSLNATGTMKFWGDFAFTNVSSGNSGAIQIDGMMGRDSTNGCRIIDNLVMTVWEDSNGTYGITASASSDGILILNASCPANVRVIGKVITVKSY